ncbi:glycoside hydrolase family 3 [Planosporangium flavigriseum]|uniref:beta-N-acetylhexosaminidase n=1 Tax=Planosporangium flavigriseum TaxID=373681 RepID=A0A8J3LXI3_9ACTN|nr:glycoside hydrolase family 3 N-terminal domain-containing protein [Planosporangium flavigriseum]NJC63385.1 glycoside hydrolase family 3 [Planosporangium flavigriseum]GIG75366.1 beta-N-acetylhexosaminidase [Planosporangium flavigriseum]
MDPVRVLAGIAALIAVTLLAGCGSGVKLTPADRGEFRSPAPTASQRADAAARAAALAAGLSDSDLVGQVLMPFAYGEDATKVSSAAATANREYAGVDTAAEMVEKYRLGGLILMNRSAGDPTASTNKTSNLTSPAQVRTFTDGLQAAAAKLPASVPMLIGTDQEYGVVNRLRDGIVQLPSALAFGAAGDPALTRGAWAAAGADLHAVGINVDFAPVADVVGPDGGFMGSRSYGSDPKAVSEQVSAAVQGLRDAGIAATLKHFPGHGHTSGDSHTELPALSQSADALAAGDLPPFTAGINAGADLVMSGHLDVRAIDPGVPASFSSHVLIDLLRGRLGFKGVVVSDAMNMAPAQKYPPGEAAVRALVAGNDLLLMPPDLAAAQRGLLDGLRTGQLPKARLVEAATRVLAVKLARAEYQQPELAGVNGAEGRAAAAKVSAAAVTILRGGCQGALVKGPVTVTASAGRDQQRAWLVDALRRRQVAVSSSGGAEVRLVGYGDDISDLRAGAAVTVSMDVPSLLGQARSPVLLATYSSTEASMSALADVLTGAAPAAGRSPLDVSGLPRSACAR